MVFFYFMPVSCKARKGAKTAAIAARSACCVKKTRDSILPSSLGKCFAVFARDLRNPRFARIINGQENQARYGIFVGANFREWRRIDATNGF